MKKYKYEYVFNMALCFALVGQSRAYLNLEIEGANTVFNPSLYESVLDSEECTRQLKAINNIDSLALRLQFLESGLRIPRSIQSGNLMDWGNYYQCLNINEKVENMQIEGKYCTINVPVGLINNIDIPSEIKFDPNNLVLNNNSSAMLKIADKIDEGMQMVSGRVEKKSKHEKTGIIQSIENLSFTLALCVPKPCTSEEGLNGLLFNLTSLGFMYNENFCRLNDDKPWAPVDYVTFTIFGMILILNILSTSYDLWQMLKPDKDSKNANKIYQSFSIYTNTKRLLTFANSPGTLHCVDGIRAISIIWVILGHTFSTLPPRENVLDAVNWTLSLKSLWLTCAPISVDTFFMLSGMLLVYTAADKLTSKSLMRNLHLFYLNRLLRMFPLLATAVLVQASILFRIADGPMWETVARMTNDCRVYWWSTLLYVQNYVNTTYMCVPHTWYLAIDMQLHILSPIVLIWVLSGNKKIAWIALAGSLLIILSGSTVYNYIMEFPSGTIQPARESDSLYYQQLYYVNTLPRASPFFVGMMFGYVLHVWRGEKVILSKAFVILLWTTTLILSGLIIYSFHPMKSLEWDNKVVDGLINSFVRPAWAMVLGWIIFACIHGYGGPVNWFLSLQVWKLPSRLSYGMYLFHYCTMVVTASTALAPIYFTTAKAMYRFLSEFSIAMIVSFTATLFVDAPFSVLIKMILGGNKGGKNK